MRTALISVLLIASSTIQADDDVLRAARECASRSAECRAYVEKAEREDRVIAVLPLLGQAIGLHYNCDGGEAAAMERRASKEYSAIMPSRGADVASAIERGIKSVTPGECRPLAYRQALAKFNAAMPGR